VAEAGLLGSPLHAAGAGRLEGRVEHVVSGQATHFASLEDLLAFMARVLHQRRPAD
jgi:hypothetical protein